MNDPSATPVDIEEQRNWTIDLHRQLGSWAEVAKRTGVKQGTISQFGSAKGYGGDEQKVAEAVFRYRQYIATQASIEIDLPEKPGYFETETSRQLCHMLSWAQRGKVVAAAMGPGTSKTSAATHYAACYPNVFITTLAPSSAGVNNMQIKLLAQLGEKNAVGTPQKLSDRIMERARGLANPLFIFDEVQHASEKTLEEIRSWNDEPGVNVGIAFFGNIKVMQRLEGGSRAEAFAQLFSRVSLRLIRSLPLNGDIEAMAEAWQIYDEAIVAVLRKICLTPGGLRNGSHALELASMIAASERQPLSVGNLQDAWAQLSSRVVLS